MCLLCNYLEGNGLTPKQESGKVKFLCPFHQDNSPSLTVYHKDDNPSAFCFSCQRSWDLVSLIREYEFNDIPKWDGTKRALEKAHSLGMIRTRIEKILPILELPSRIRREALEIATGHYESKMSPQALRYLETRGVSAKMAKELRLGYCPGKGLREMVGKEIEGELERLGILTLNGERMARRITIPNIRNSKVVWLQGTSINDNGCKYLGINGHREGFYGWDTLKRSGIKFIVEGFFDLVPFLANGYGGIALLGNADNNITILAERLAGQDVIVARDTGSGGDIMAGKIIKSLQGLCNVSVISPPSGIKDPNQWATTLGIDSILAEVS